MIIDEFKRFCRDKGKYNVSSLSEIIKLFDEFEKARHAINSQTGDEESAEEVEEKAIDFSEVIRAMK